MTNSHTMISSTAAYRAGVGTAVVTSLLTVWTTIVRDDGNGAGFFLIIMAAAVGGFAARFRADGLARTMAGVAAMQVSFGLAVATAPVVMRTPDGSTKALVSSAVFAGLWLAAAAWFRTAAKRG